jgi:uncharacterized membrane protein YdjX (TVP38/TMEM64 family)
VPVQRQGASRRTIVIRLALVALAGALFLSAILWLKRMGVFQRALEWLSSLGPWAPVAFFVLYLIAVILMVPASIFTMGAGAIFGFVRGGAYVLAAATVASVICFVIARHFARDWVARRLGQNAKFRAIDQAIEREGWKIVVLVRLAPVLPFSLTSYGFGITRVPLWQYLAASFAMIPGTLWYVYLGTLLGDVTGLQQPAPVPAWIRVLIALTAFIALFYLTRFVRRAIARSTGE